MNVLHLVPRWTVETKMARERFQQVDALAAAPHVRVETWGPGYDGWDHGTTAAENVARLDAPRAFVDRLTFVLAYGMDGHRLDGCAPRGEAACHVPVAVVLQEAYNRPKTDRVVRSMNARLVAFTYANELPQYAHFATEGRYLAAVPHGVDPLPYEAALKQMANPERAWRTQGSEVYNLGGWDRDIDVLIVGNMNAEIYPLRVRLANLAWRELRKRGYRVVWAQHPGYELPARTGVVGDAYVRLLTRARLVVTCTSRYRYALTKLLEIPLAGAFAVSDVPAERRAFFRRTLLEVEPRMLDREILALVEDVLDDEPERLRRVKGAQDRVVDRCLMSFWAERFLYHARVALLGETPPRPRPDVAEEDAE